MRRFNSGYIIGGLLCLGVIGFLIAQIPSIKSRLDWRLETSITYLRGMVNPAEDRIPTPLPTLPQPRLVINHLPTPTPAPCRDTSCQTPSPTPLPSPTPTATPTPIPLPPGASVIPPDFEKQDQNNCGPATLSHYLRFYGWQGDQYSVSKVVKPDITDRNVNVDELVYYVRTKAGWLSADYRVGGDLELLKRFIASGLPIMIEEESKMDKIYWPNDDLWAGHYLLLTGYDDTRQIFITQDSWLGPNLNVGYTDLDKRWQTFNRVYIMVYPPEKANLVKTIVGASWDEATSRTNALRAAQKETIENPRNAFAWFNMGTNLLYFDQYSEAAQSYDTARQIGLPQRMLRYQFGPFIAYFKTNRNSDLLAIADYAMKITPNSEENLLWHGYALYREGKKEEAINDFQKALKANPFYTDAQYAITFVRNN